MKREKKIGEFLFFIAYGIYLLTTIIGSSFYAIYFHSYTKYILLFCVLLLLLKECLRDKIKIRDLVLLFLCGILLCIAISRESGSVLYSLFFFIYSARDIEFRKIAKFTVFVSGFTLLFVILSAKLGIITNYHSINNGRERYFLGFLYALYPQMILFNITLCFLFYKANNLSFKSCLLLTLFNYYVFKYTDSRLSFYLSIFAIYLVYFLIKKISILKQKKVWKLLLVFSYPICAICSLYLTYAYNSNNYTMRQIDSFFGARLYYGHEFLEQNEITFLGNDVTFVGAGLNFDGTKNNGTYNYVDCLYVVLLGKYGLLFFSLYILLHVYVMNRFRREEEEILLVLFSLFALHGIIDDLMINLCYNCFWLSMGNFLSSKKERSLAYETI